MRVLLPGELFNRMDFLMRDLRNRLITLDNFLNKEMQSPRRMPWKVALSMWLKGFTSDSFYICQLDRNKPEDYLSDLKRFKTRMINGDYSIVLNNKVLFEVVIGSKVKVPKTFAFIHKGQIIPFNDGAQISSLDDVISMLESGEILVAKPVRSGGGENVFILELSGSGILVNRNEKGVKEFRAFLEGLDSFVLTEYVRQGLYAREIFPDVVNTVRFLTMLEDTGEPFIAFAVHKFGTRTSYPVDNWRRGGITALVDLETGEIGAPISYSGGGVYRRFECHPDSGSPIEGVRIPKWEERKDLLLRLAKSLPFLKYVGWDVAIGDESVTVIEGNSYTDVNLFQAHRPFLIDDRVRRFYKRHGIIP